MKVLAHTGFTAKESKEAGDTLPPSSHHLPQDQVSTKVMRFLLQNQEPPWAWLWAYRTAISGTTDSLFLQIPVSASS